MRPPRSLAHAPVFQVMFAWQNAGESDVERHQLLVEWNATEADYPRDKCLHELFETQAARTPDAIAVVHEDTQLTYAELNAKADRLAHHLRALGVKPDALLAICVERSLEMVVGLLAVLKAGGAYVPLDPTTPATPPSGWLACWKTARRRSC